MIDILIFLIVLALAFFSMWMCLQYREVFLGSLSCIFFLLLAYWSATGVDTSSMNFAPEEEFGSFDYQLVPSPEYTGQRLILNSNYNPVVETNTNYELSTHIFQEGGVIINVSTACILHLYGLNGHHSIIGNMTLANGVDYEYEIPASNFSKAGKYEYRIICQSGTGPQTRYGAVESYIIVKDEEEYANYTLTSIFALLAIFIVFEAVSFLRSESEEKDEENHL